MAKLGDYQVTGLDVSQTFVEIARKNAAEAKVKVQFRHGNASQMPFDNAQFDYIVCRAAFKNFAEPGKAIEELHRVLKPGGRALIVDLRRNATPQSITEAVNGMNLSMFNRFITRLTFRFMLLKRAWTKPEFEQLVAQTKFGKADIREELIGLEVVLKKL